MCHHKISRKTDGKKEKGGEVGPSIIARLERNLLCVKKASFYVGLAASQFLFPCMKTCMSFVFHTESGGLEGAGLDLGPFLHFKQIYFTHIGSRRYLNANYRGADTSNECYSQ